MRIRIALDHIDGVQFRVVEVTDLDKDTLDKVVLSTYTVKELCESTSVQLRVIDDAVYLWKHKGIRDSWQ